MARYIERALSGPLSHLLPVYAEGLEAIDIEAREAYGRGFVELGEDGRDRILSRAELGRCSRSVGDISEFFELLRTHSIEGMFGDPRHGGNAQFVGWRLIGYPGARLSVAVDDQQLDAPLTPEMKSINGLEFCAHARARPR